jgi:hypothetical protein
VFMGHFAIGFGAKRAAPAVSLGMLFLACQLADLLWPWFVLLGIERVAIDPGNTAATPLNFIAYPYSHSLVALAAWAVVVALLYRWIRRSTIAAALTLAAVVISHWVLDVISHRPDMPLTIGGTTRLGLGLWNSIPATVGVETVMLVIGLVLYLNATEARDRIGSIGLWSLLVFLVVINVASLAGPPPPSPTAVAWTAQAMWLIVLWAFWVDRHRAMATPAS